MCKPKSQGGRRCSGHVKQRIRAAKEAMAAAEEGTAEYESAANSLATAQEQYLLTKEGITDYITTHASTPPDNTRECVDTINAYLATAAHPDKGSTLNLPGGTYTILKARESGGNILFDVALNPRTCTNLTTHMVNCYNESPAGKQVTVVEARDFPRHFSRMYITSDGKAGGGIKKDGEIAALFSQSPLKGVAKSVIEAAADDGGTHLECFDTFLPRIYSKAAGMTEVARIKFVRDYAPEGWDYETMGKWNNGEPDIVFMATRSHYENIGSPEAKSYDSWDDAHEYVTTGACSTQDNVS